MKTSVPAILVTLLVIYCTSNVCAQLQGTETTETVQIYKGTFIVNGDKDTYYPVVFKFGNQNLINNVKIYRAYNEAGPPEFSPTHKGGLALEIDVNYGVWGGIVYDWRVMDLRQLYHETFAGAELAMHSAGFLLWMRGGGFVYHYESNKTANIQVAYSTSELIWDRTIDSQDVYAPAPKTTIDWDDINAHKNDHWDYLKGKPTSVGSWELNGNNLSYQGGSVAIGTVNPGTHALAVEGTIGAREVKVNTDVWPDFVFEEDYELQPLSEIETFIKENKHLPDIPSEAEVKENGISVGEMNAKLLQKIEELTLYILEQNKRIEKLEEKCQNK